MKERLWGRSQPDGTWDAIVVGSGVGGMACAAMLARTGLRVLILEQHTIPGGFTHTFKRKRFEWDVGVHTVGEIGDAHLPGRLMSYLTDGTLQWDSTGPVCEHFHFPGLSLNIPRERSEQYEILRRAFPHEREGIDAFERHVDEVIRSLPRYYTARSMPASLSGLDRFIAGRAWKWFGRRTGDVLRPLISDPRLFEMLTARWVYYGAPPSRSSFGVHAIVTNHFYEGGFYPRGGSSSLARSFLAGVNDAGGWTRTRASVETILCRGRRAVGVRLESGEELLAPRVIVATPVHTFLRLLPKPLPRWSQGLQALPGSPAHVCLYLGLSEKASSIGLTGGNTWLCDTPDAVWHVEPDQALPDPGVLYCSFPTLKTKAKHPSSKHTAEIITFVPWEAFAQWKASSYGRRDASYLAFKQRLTDALLKRVYQAFEGLEDCVEYVELSTPLTTNHYMATLQGDIYGLAPTPERYHHPYLRPRTPIKGLYLAGSDMASPGVMGAMMGGVMGALASHTRPVFSSIRSFL